MENWHQLATKLLEKSLYPVPTELNNLDWKSGLSPKTDRLAQHICAFSNLIGGGFLVFGVNNDGSLCSVEHGFVEKTVLTLGNIAKNNLIPSTGIEHVVLEFKSHHLLFVYIPEQDDKPTYLRGKDLFSAYTRSAGQTVKMTKRQVQMLIAQSRGIPFEEQEALRDLHLDQVLDLLNYKKLFELLERNVPKNSENILNKLIELGYVKQVKDNNFSILNLGALLFARDLNNFPDLKGRNIIVRQYKGSNNRDLHLEQRGVYGYAAGFEGLLGFIMMQLPKLEIIESIRKDIPIYPEVAIREFVANALVHQDFTIEGMPITIELFDNRLSITNPGTPLEDLNRLLDLPPRSRNEGLAQAMFLLGICERRGSGIDRAIEAIEKQKLPPVKFEKSETHTKVILFPPKDLKDMSKTERIRACYQHACLLHEDNKELNNQSLRERLGIGKDNAAIASRIIADTLAEGLIKYADPAITSKKYANYLPYYA